MRITTCLFIALALAYSAPAKKKPQPSALPPASVRLFVGDSETFFATSSAAATAGVKGGSAYGGSYAGYEKMTVLAMKAFHENCSPLLIVQKPDSADYMLRLDRNGIFLRHNAIAIFNKVGEMVFVGAGLSLQKQAKKFCGELPEIQTRVSK
jgi:hypothetical protein